MKTIDLVDLMVDLSSDPPTLTQKKQKHVKPPFGYYGAKQRIARKIIDLLPPHSAWVEAFCGSAAVTLAKPRAEIEVINDIDDQVVNLFTILRERPDELCRVLQLTPYARTEFGRARLGETALDTLEKARRFIVATMMTVNGTHGSNHGGFSFSDSYSRGGREARVNRWYQLPERLEEVVDRLRSVRIENKDARALLKQFSARPATLIYLDPPYLMDRHHKYTHDANESSFHEELLGLCSNASCMLIISGYENELYSGMLPTSAGWTKMNVETTTRGTKGVDVARTEVLWMNEPFVAACSTNRSRIALSQKEKKERKINPKRESRRLQNKKSQPEVIWAKADDI